MKTLITILLCITAIIVKAQMPYRAFGDSLGKWSQEYGSCDSWTSGLGFCLMHGWVNDLSNDTIVNNLVYRKVGHQESWYYFKNENSGEIIEFNYSLMFPSACIGGLREDSIKRIWFRRFENPIAPVDLFPFNFELTFPIDSDIIIYDFNLQLGDTVSWKACCNIVTAIDSIQILNNEWRRRFTFSASDFWVEGIGAGTGLFGAYCYPPFEHNLKLDCYKILDSLLFQNYFYSGMADCESIYIGIDEPSQLDNIKVFPNPAHDQLLIYGDVDLKEFSIYDVYGRLIYEQSNSAKRYAVDVRLLRTKGCVVCKIITTQGTVKTELISLY
jgi:hypothetical protein